MTRPAALTTAGEPYGTTRDGQAVERWVFGSDALRVTMITWGATITRVEVPDRDGRPGDVALGLGSLEDYEARSPCFGSTVGRFANRIAGGRFTLDGVEHQVPVNDPEDHPVNALHGGPHGFDARVWAAEAVEREHEAGVAFTLLSPDGDQGFPGALAVRVEYVVSGGALGVRYRATTDAPTVVNLTNHVYLDLAGEGAGTVEDHVMTVRARRFVPVDAAAIPLGTLEEVAGTPFDFRSPRAIGERIRQGDQQLVDALGYDHCWVLDEDLDREVVPVVQVADPASGRVLEVFTDQVGVQVYTANRLTGSLVGPGGRTYRQGSAFTVETQHLPDSPRHPSWPSTVLRPGETFTSWTRLAFSAR